MNGIHDMGGMHGFGAVQREEREPVFHEPWERRVFGLLLATGRLSPFPRQGGLRSSIENLDPATYLSSSYYDRWERALEKALVAKGHITAEEMIARTEYFQANPEAETSRSTTEEDPSSLLRALKKGRRPHVEAGIAAKFNPGDIVIARTTNPIGHTRLPRYVRGKRGVIELYYGTHIFQDTLPEGIEPEAQPVYSVRFQAIELWGESAEPGVTIYLDLWEDYLEQVKDQS